MLAAPSETTENVPEPVIVKKRKRVIDSDEEGDDCDDCESEEDDEEETEEDRAFINDGRVEKAEDDSAAVNVKNIISDDTGGRPKRQRKAPERWEHPDAANVMRKFCEKWQVTDEDIKEIFEQEEDDAEVVDEEDSSFHTDVDEDDDDDGDDNNDEDEPAENEDDDEEEYETTSEDDDEEEEEDEEETE